MNRLSASLLCLLLAVAAAPAIAQEKPYADGPVVVVNAIKVVDGQFENYMAYLNGTWRKVQEASKEAGLVTEYHVYSATPHNPNEADLYLVVTYPNMAAFDGIERGDATRNLIFFFHSAQGTCGQEEAAYLQETLDLVTSMNAGSAEIHTFSTAPIGPERRQFLNQLAEANGGVYTALWDEQQP